MYENQFRNDSPSYNSYPSLTTTVSNTMKKVYLKMTLALVVTALTSFLCASSHAFLSFVLTNSWFMIAIVIAELFLVYRISSAIQRMSNGTATLLFYLYSILNGLMLSTIFLAYSIDAIAKTFLITALTFGAMSIYGYFTNRDLSRVGSFLFMALIGLMIAMLVNIFLKSSSLDWIISIAGVLIFVGLTAWDTQQIKTMAQQAPGEAVSRLATLGALTLYLDFINLFLFLLRIFGGSRD